MHFSQENVRLRNDNAKLKNRLASKNQELSGNVGVEEDSEMEELKEHNVRLKQTLADQVK
jgi:hypothetical protein